jgi:NAD(P)-dependent dehydrogenase (short-subunit alcohol dehydrogenase family)
MVDKLVGKVAVVTGAGSEIGIGKEVAKAMAAEGAKVVVNDIVKDPDGSMGADRVVKEIKDTKGTAAANYDSVASMEGGASIIKAAIDNFGRIDILVNTAGNFIVNPTMDMSEAQWDAIIDVHLKGLFACTQAAVREMIKQKSGGRIINISSRGAFMYDPLPPGLSSVAYSAAKAGILGLTACLAAEFMANYITVNAIVPSASTGLFPGRGRRWFGGGVRENADYLAPVIVYLATDEAESITAQIIFSSSGNICILPSPMMMPMPGAQHIIEKQGKWTIEELIQQIPPMVGVDVPGHGGTPGK